MRKIILFLLILYMPNLYSNFIIVGIKQIYKNEKTAETRCFYCKHPTLEAVSIQSWLTLYFFAILATSSKRYYLECPCCGSCFRIKAKVESLAELLDDASARADAQDNYSLLSEEGYCSSSPED